MRIRSVLAWGLVGGVVGCGGNVVFVDDGGGGSGAAGPTSGPTSGPDTSVTATSVTTGFMSACQAVCSVASDCFQGDCLSECASFYVPGCEAPTDAFFFCAASALPPGVCELPAGACEQEAAAFASCMGGPQDCSQSACAFEVCNCSADCFGGTLVADCDGFGPSTCDCYFNDAYIGSCDGQTCVVDQSCCYDLVLTPD